MTEHSSITDIYVKEEDYVGNDQYYIEAHCACREILWGHGASRFLAWQNLHSVLTDHSGKQ